MLLSKLKENIGHGKPCPFFVGKNMDDFVTRAEHIEFSKRMENEHDIQGKRITALEKAVDSINQITVNVERLAISMENMTKELERQGNRLDAIEETPKKRWESIIAALVAGLVGFALNSFLSGAFIK